MPDIAKLVEKLQTGSKNARYEACEELRVADTVTQEALQALERASEDPDSGVADAARRALYTHRPPPAPTPVPPLNPTGFPGQSTPSHSAPETEFSNRPQYVDPVWLSDWLKAILEQQRKQTGYLRNLSAVATIITLIIIFNLVFGGCSALSGF